MKGMKLWEYFYIIISIIAMIIFLATSNYTAFFWSSMAMVWFYRFTMNERENLSLKSRIDKYVKSLSGKVNIGDS
jgi:hypothetical protein